VVTVGSLPSCGAQPGAWTWEVRSCWAQRGGAALKELKVRGQKACQHLIYLFHEPLPLSLWAFPFWALTALQSLTCTAVTALSRHTIACLLALPLLLLLLCRG
jgi:hypothetical protein